MQPLSRIFLALAPVLLLACDAETGPDPDERRTRLTQHRELGRAHVDADGDGDADAAIEKRLAADQLLLVDPMSTGSSDQTRYVLMHGALPEAPPDDIEALLAAPTTADRLIRNSLKGGRDSSGPAIFEEIVAGSYTVCVAASAPPSPEQAALLARLEAAFASAPAGEMTQERFNAAIAQATREAGHEAVPIDWRARPLRCKSFTVTADPASRVVELE